MHMSMMLQMHVMTLTFIPTFFVWHQSAETQWCMHRTAMTTVVCLIVARANKHEHAQHFREATHSKIKLEKESGRRKEKEESDLAGIRSRDLMSIMQLP